MAVKMRLRRMGQKKAPFYRIIVADSRSPRDGVFPVFRHWGKVAGCKGVSAA